MHDRPTILETKSREILRTLERWARKQKILAAGEQIAFSMRVVAIPTVVKEEAKEERNPLLDMTVGSYFTRERCENAGVSKVIRGRIVSIPIRRHWAIQNGAKARQINTVRDLIEEGCRNLSQMKSIGSGMINTIRQVLQKDGLDLRE